MTWLAIETLDDGELLHGVSHDMDELHTRALTKIAHAVLEEHITPAERDEITNVIRSALSKGLSPVEATVHAEHEIIGVSRREKIYQLVKARFARVAFTRG